MSLSRETGTMAKSFGAINVDESGGIHTITLNRPERRNALNPQMLGELSEALETAEHCSCGAVVLTGAGKAFCSGMDLEHLRVQGRQRPEDQRDDLEAFMWVMRRIYDFPKPTIAAVNGAAMAGGFGLATLCDFTIAAESAIFGYTEVRVGFIPAIVAVFLVAMVGEKRTRQLLLAGWPLASEEALAMGLVTELTTAQQLIPRTREIATSLMRNSPESMRQIKKLLGRFSKERLDRDLRTALQLSERVRNSPDFQEGIQAFLEKRAPVWSRREQP